MGSVKCGVSSVQCKAWSVEPGVLSEERKVWSAKCVE